MKKIRKYKKIAVIDIHQKGYQLPQIKMHYISILNSINIDTLFHSRNRYSRIPVIMPIKPQYNPVWLIDNSTVVAALYINDIMTVQ